MVGCGGRRQAEDRRRVVRAGRERRNGSWWNWKRSRAKKRRTRFKLPSCATWKPSRQQGVVVVQIARGIAGEVAKSSGLLQIDAAELPPALARGNWAFSYRYATVPYELAVSLEKILPRISAHSLVNAYLDPEGLAADVLTVFNIERSGVFKLEYDLPPGFDLRSVKGIASGDAQAAQVDNHRLEGEKQTHLVVNLSGKALGKVAILLNLRKDLRKEQGLTDLLASPGKSANIDFAIPQVTAKTVERATGNVAVFAPESLRVNADKLTGLGKTSYAEATKEIAMPQPSEKAESHRPVFAYSFTQEPASLTLVADRRKPQVTVRQLLVVRIEDGAAKYRAAFFYNVLYSGVKSLRIDLPEEVAKIANTKTTHEVIAPPPADLPPGYVAWRLSNNAELFGEGKIELEWEKKFDLRETGKPEKLPLPHLKPAEVDRAHGEIVLTKSESIDLREDEKEKPEGLPADRSAAGLEGEGGRRGQGVLLPRRLEDDRARHALTSLRT